MPAEASWENMICRPSLSASNTREGRQYLKLERVWQGMTKEAFWGWNTVSDACGMFDLHQRDTV